MGKDLTANAETSALVMAEADRFCFRRLGRAGPKSCKLEKTKTHVIRRVHVNVDAVVHARRH
jgi:hypothetical protein